MYACVLFALVIDAALNQAILLPVKTFYSQTTQECVCSYVHFLFLSISSEAIALVTSKYDLTDEAFCLGL